MSQRRITDDLHVLMGVLPSKIADAVNHKNNSDQLLEIVADLGRRPFARFVSGDVELLDEEVSRDDLDFVIERIGDFDADNRAGLERTLHRISGIRNRRGARGGAHLPRGAGGLWHGRYHPRPDRVG